MSTEVGFTKESISQIIDNSVEMDVCASIIFEKYSYLWF